MKSSLRNWIECSMLVDSGIIYYKRLRDLYFQVEKANSESFSLKKKILFSMRMKCKFISLLQKKKHVSHQQVAEFLNLPLFAIREIEKGRFPMSQRTFLRLGQNLGETRESLVFCRTLQRKLQLDP